MKLFFSYGHDENEPIVDRLKRDLESDGHEVWIDYEKIANRSVETHDSDWRTSITNGITDSDIVLSFASAHALRDNGVCLDELKIAVFVRGAFVQAVLLEPEIEGSVPASIAHRQFIDFSDWREHLTNGELKGSKFEDWYAPRLEDIRKMLGKDEVKSYHNDLEELDRYLRPYTGTSKQDKLAQSTFVGRKWLSEKVKKWAKGNDQALLITASPGAGKSAFVVNEFMTSPHVGAAVFCQFSNEGANNIDAIAASIAYQLAARYDDYRKALLEVCRKEQEERKAGFTPRDSGPFERYILAIANGTLINGNREYFIILIDGIDEAKIVDGENPLAQALAAQIGMLPSYARFILTSRNDDYVLTPLEEIDRIDLDRFGGENEQDVADYVASNLGKDHALLPEIVKCSRGNFLYAQLACAHIDDLVAGAPFPKGLKGFYSDDIKRLRGKAEFSSIRNALGVIATSEEGVPKETLCRAVDWIGEDGYRYAEFKEQLSMYLLDEDGKLAFFHKSFADWLDSDESGRYRCDSQYAQQLLAKACFDAYQEDIGSMNDYEMTNLFPLLQKSQQSMRDKYEKVLADQTFVSFLATFAGMKEKVDLDSALRLYKAAISINKELAKREPTRRIDTLSFLFGKIRSIYAQVADDAHILESYHEELDLLATLKVEQSQFGEFASQLSPIISSIISSVAGRSFISFFSRPLSDTDRQAIEEKATLLIDSLSSRCASSDPNEIFHVHASKAIVELEKDRSPENPSFRMSISDLLDAYYKLALDETAHAQQAMLDAHITMIRVFGLMGKDELGNYAGIENAIELSFYSALDLLTTSLTSISPFEPLGFDREGKDELRTIADVARILERLFRQAEQLEIHDLPWAELSELVISLIADLKTDAKEVGADALRHYIDHLYSLFTLKYFLQEKLNDIDLVDALEEQLLTYTQLQQAFDFDGRKDAVLRSSINKSRLTDQYEGRNRDFADEEGHLMHTLQHAKECLLKSYLEQVKHLFKLCFEQEDFDGRNMAIAQLQSLEHNAHFAPQNIAEMNNTSELLDVLSMMLIKCGEYEQGIAALNRLISVNIESDKVTGKDHSRRIIEAHLDIARYSHVAHDDQEATSHYEGAFRLEQERFDKEIQEYQQDPNRILSLTEAFANTVDSYAQSIQKVSVETAEAYYLECIRLREELAKQVMERKRDQDTISAIRYEHMLAESVSRYARYLETCDRFIDAANQYQKALDIYQQIDPAAPASTIDKITQKIADLRNKA